MAKKVKKKTEPIGITQVEAVRSTALAEIKSSTPAMVSKAAALMVTTADEETVAYDAVGEIKRRLKNADTMRKEITGPLEAAKKKTIQLFKDLTEPLREAQGLLTDKIGDFRDEQDRIAEEAEEERDPEMLPKEKESESDPQSKNISGGAPEEKKSEKIPPPKNSGFVTEASKTRLRGS